MEICRLLFCVVGFLLMVACQTSLVSSIAAPSPQSITVSPTPVSNPAILMSATAVSTSTPINATMTAIVVTPTPINIDKATAVPTAQPTVASHIPAPPNTAPLLPDWLIYLNQFRQLAGLPILAEDTALSLGSQLHSEYMNGNDNPIARYQLRNNSLYTEAGGRAARNSNIYATSDMNSSFDWAINFWMSAPFHALPILNPQLQRVGYGETYDETGVLKGAAVLDVRSGVKTEMIVTYPVFFPPDRGQTWIIRHTLLEYPELTDTCPGYDKPLGPPMILQLGNGEITPHVTNYQFKQGQNVLPACVFDETSYFHQDEYAQQVGRDTLDAQDAVILMPRYPLQVGKNYQVQMTVNGQTYAWQFKATERPEITAVPDFGETLPEFTWPVTSRALRQRFSRKHLGLDIETPVGSPVVASAAGTVEYARWHDNGYGNLVILRHAPGVYTYYAHLDTVYVHEGDIVNQGTLIAASGNTGHSDLPHVHLEIIVNYYQRLNPCEYLLEQIELERPLASDETIKRQQLDCGYQWIIAARPSA